MVEREALIQKAFSNLHVHSTLDSVAKVFLGRRSEFFRPLCGYPKIMWGESSANVDSPVASVVGLRVHQSAIAARFVFWREIGNAAISEFCDTILSEAVIDGLSGYVSVDGSRVARDKLTQRHWSGAVFCPAC